MRWITTLLFAVTPLVVSVSRADQFVVRNRVAETTSVQEFRVTNHCPLTRLVTRTRTVLGLRAPVGHTHTCGNGHTWDHQATSGHSCPHCGQSQYVQDRSPRMVTVARTVQFTEQVPVVAVTPAPQPAPARPVVVNASVGTSYDSLRALGVTFATGAGGCANGQCSTVSRGRLR